MRILFTAAGAAAVFTVGFVGLIALSGGVVSAQDTAQPSVDQLEIQVTMQEYSISPRHAVVRANQPVQFTVTNIGAEQHRFNVIGFGERWRATDDRPGGTTVVDATFPRAGVYQLYCSSHRESMVGTLTVVPEAEEASLRVPVTLQEFRFQPVAQVTIAGQPTRFELTNVGELFHRFEIAGYGNQWPSPAVGPGESVSWTVTIDTPGSYEVYCPFTTGGNHKDLGKVGVLEVLPSGSAMMMSR